MPIGDNLNKWIGRWNAGDDVDTKEVHRICGRLGDSNIDDCEAALGALETGQVEPEDVVTFLSHISGKEPKEILEIITEASVSEEVME